MDTRTFQRELERKYPEVAKKVSNDLALQIANEIERNRVARRLTQSDLAREVGTQQSGISRLERGARLPSLTFVRKVANAMGMYVQCTFHPFVQVLPVEMPTRTQTGSVTNLEAASSSVPVFQMGEWSYNPTGYISNRLAHVTH